LRACNARGSAKRSVRGACGGGEVLLLLRPRTLQINVDDYRVVAAQNRQPVSEWRVVSILPLERTPPQFLRLRLLIRVRLIADLPIAVGSGAAEGAGSDSIASRYLAQESVALIRRHILQQFQLIWSGGRKGNLRDSR
jgi:hypothetical protein